MTPTGFLSYEQLDKIKRECRYGPTMATSYVRDLLTEVHNYKEHLADRIELEDRLSKERNKLRAELATLKASRPAPRCPECGSMDLHVSYAVKDKWQVMCSECLHERDGFKTIDAALDAWRGGSK